MRSGVELEEFEAKRAEAAAEEELAAAAAGAAAADMSAGGGLPLRESSEAIRQLRRNATGALEQVRGVCGGGEGGFVGFLRPVPGKGRWCSSRSGWWRGQWLDCSGGGGVAVAEVTRNALALGG
jgi:hypothetical protein